MRTLASIQRITAIDPIEGADAIEVASVLGWQVVTKKGEYQVGDLAVYMEIDSVPPDEEQYRFLWKNTEFRPNNFRIKTIKLRGQISQGILFPLGLFGDHGPWNFPTEGEDVTDRIGVTKYEAPLPRGSADVEGQFFDGVPKTDEERVQSSTGAKHLASLRGRPFYITEKLDGASMTVAMHEGVPKVASRNYRLADAPDSAYWNAARNEGILRFINENPHLAIQGELIGPGIQGNKLGWKEHSCFVFNVYDRNTGRFWSMAEMVDVLGFEAIPMVPIVIVGHLFNYTQEQLLTLAEGKYAGTKNEREGIVIRSNDGLESVSFKCVSNRYLLRGGE